MAALAMTWQTQLLLNNSFLFTPFTVFVFFSTFLLYAVHRLVSLQKLNSDNLHPRFAFILPYRFLLKIAALLAIPVVIVCFFYFSKLLKISLLLPILLSIGYALPVLPNGRRLRDLGFIKNLLIASVWAWVTVILPALEWNIDIHLPIIIMALGRFCFIFALSLPFDIRDITLDQQAQVNTFPVIIGITPTKRIAIFLNILSISFAAINWHLGFYTFGNLTGIVISILVSSVLIWHTFPERSDFYFAGLLDGVMILQFLLIWLL